MCTQAEAKIITKFDLIAIHFVIAGLFKGKIHPETCFQKACLFWHVVVFIFLTPITKIQ